VVWGCFTHSAVELGAAGMFRMCGNLREEGGGGAEFFFWGWRPLGVLKMGRVWDDGARGRGCA